MAALRPIEKAIFDSLDRIDDEPAERFRIESLASNLVSMKELLTDSFRAGILGRLKEERLFGPLAQIAERMLLEAEMDASQLQCYGQALIELGNLYSAECVLKSALLATTPKSDLWYDIQGVLGRVYKQRFVELVALNADIESQNRELKKALNQYQMRTDDAYFEVNLIALAKRIKIEKRQIPDIKVDIKTIARKLLKKIESKTERSEWDFPVALGACFALAGQKLPTKTLRYVNDMLDSRKVRPFEIGSTLRQLEEIFLAKTDLTGAEEILKKLRANLIGRYVEIKNGPPLAVRIIVDALASESGTRKFEWLKQGCELAKSVAFIQTPQKSGSGFLLNAADIDKTLKPQTVLVTNCHVTDGVLNPNTTVTFKAYGSRVFKLAKQLAYSQVEDVAIYTVADLPADLQPLPAAPPNFVPGPKSSVYLIGYPERILSVSIYNNLVLSSDKRAIQYSADTDEGSSGSPVFNESWQVIAIHQARSTYSAPGERSFLIQGGRVLQAILEQAKLEHGPGLKTKAASS